MAQIKENYNKIEEYMRHELIAYDATLVPPLHSCTDNASAMAPQQQVARPQRFQRRPGTIICPFLLFILTLIVICNPGGEAAPITEQARDTNLEWQNPCSSGNFDSQGITLPDIFYLNELRNIATKEYNKLQIQKTGGIDISDIKDWARHSGRYRFLPHLANNSKVNLKQWHTDLQIFVGAFGCLERAKYNNELLVQHTPISETTKELNELLRNSRSMLCEVETAIRNIHPQRHHVHILSRAEMNEKLNFHIQCNRQSDSMHHAQTDFMFAKYKYQRFVKAMARELLKNVKKYIEQHGSHYQSLSIDSASVSSDESEMQH